MQIEFSNTAPNSSDSPEKATPANLPPERAGRSAPSAPKAPRPQPPASIAVRIVRGLFLTAARPTVPNVRLLAKAVASHITRVQRERSAPARPGNTPSSPSGVAADTTPAHRPPVVVITGPSGGGKSVLLAAVARTLCHRSSAAKTTEPTQSPRSIRVIRVNLLRGLIRDELGQPALSASGGHHGRAFTCDPPRTSQPQRANAKPTEITSNLPARIAPGDPSSVQHWLGCLASAGLAEAGVLLLPVHKLSTGQRARYALARAMHRCLDGAPGSCVLLVDELGAALDPITAVSVATSLQRWSAATGIGLVAATTDPRTAAALKADLQIDLPVHTSDKKSLALP